MHLPEAVLAQAVTRYDNVWRDQLLTPNHDTYSFPLKPPTPTTIYRDPASVSIWIKTWRSWGEVHPQAHLQPGVVGTRFGDQPVFTHLGLAGIAELAALNSDTQEHWTRARARWAAVSDGVDPAAVRPWLQQIVALADLDFEILQAAVEWFRGNPRSGHTIRRVPVSGMHTKWLARHRRLVIALLGGTTGSPTEDVEDSADPVDLPADELDILGLKPLPREIDILLLDEGHRAQIGGLRQLRGPADEIARLPLQPRDVLIVENKEAALPLRDRQGIVVIHSLGNHLDVLAQISWIGGARCWYWGDLDRHGFTLLSRARHLLPRTTSLLMDPQAVREHRRMAVIERITRLDDPHPTLTPDEIEALGLLPVADGYLRIEQERIPTTIFDTELNRRLAPGD